jgi:hypothetical protein
MMPEKKQAGYQTPRFHRDDWLGYRTAAGEPLRDTRVNYFATAMRGLGLNQPDKCQTEGDGPKFSH